MTIFNYTDAAAIGTVFSVDTTSVVVQVENEEQLRSLQVNRLVVLRSAYAGQHLVAIIARISRRIVGEAAGTGGEETETLVENALKATLLGTMHDRVGTRGNVFRRSLESVPEIGARCFVLDGARLTEFMQAISSQLGEGEHPLVLGTYALDAEAPAWLDGNKFFQRHAVVVGSTGSGKSWTVAKLLEQIADLDNANALLFDIHGEYADITGDGIRHLRVAGPSDLASGAELADSVLHLPYWLLTYEEMIAMLLDRSDSNAPNQAMVFARAVRDQKRRILEAGEHAEVLENFTLDSPVPFALEAVLDELRRLDDERVPGSGSSSANRDKAGPFNGKLTRFVQRLESKVEDRRLGFMFGGPTSTSAYDWLDRLVDVLLAARSLSDHGGVKVIDFSEVPSDVLPLVIGLVSRLVFTVQMWARADQRHPVLLMCDEAHLYMPASTSDNSVSEVGLRAFERIAKEGRKYGTALTVISQRPADVNRTVLSQCSNFVVMRLTNAEDQQVVRRLLPDSLSGFAELLPVLDIGEALVVGDASLLPSRVRITPPRQRPNSATIEFWSEWSASEASQDLSAAVRSLRRQSSS